MSRSQDTAGMKDKLQAALDAIKPGLKLQEDMDILQVGLDSMQVVTFFIEVEDQVGVPVSEEDIDAHELTVIANLIPFLLARRA